MLYRYSENYLAGSAPSGMDDAARPSNRRADMPKLIRHERDDAVVGCIVIDRGRRVHLSPFLFRRTAPFSFCKIQTRLKFYRRPSRRDRSSSAAIGGSGVSSGRTHRGTMSANRTYRLSAIAGSFSNRPQFDQSGFGDTEHVQVNVCAKKFNFLIGIRYACAHLHFEARLQTPETNCRAIQSIGHISGRCHRAFLVERTVD